MRTSHESGQEQQREISRIVETTFSSVYCLRFHRLNLLRLTENSPWSRIPENSCRSHLKKQKMSDECINVSIKQALGTSLSKILPSVDRLAHSLPHSRKFENFNFFMRFQHTENSCSAEMSCLCLKSRDSLPGSAPNSPSPCPILNFFSW